MAKILLVEDEQDLAHLIRNWLEREHHLVELSENGHDALCSMELNKYDVIILDIMLPGMNGLEVCRKYRQAKGNTPILMITAKNSIDDKESGLDAGADDYLTKPFHLKEVAARVRALLRRGISLPSNVLKIRDITIDPVDYKVTKAGLEIHLLPQEFRLLEFLARHPNQVFSAEDLLSSVWESDTPAMIDTVRGHIKRIRKKLDTPGASSIISNVYGLGYKIESSRC
ncbi:MAG: response regulator transcription factor [Candidatus Obscuribacterales bacterium]|nr:response regulator transcription factor [Candidatus Obscuribacterales bacterium]